MIYRADSRVIFLIVGEDRVAYGGDLDMIAEKSFKEHVLKQDEYDLSRLLFLGRLSPQDLAQVLSLSNPHIYLTVPFVLSWSLLNAVACDCVVLGPDTVPVREVIRPGENGLLVDFFDADGLAAAALEMLAQPEAYRPLARAAEETIHREYSLRTVLPRMAAFYGEVATGKVVPPSR